MLLPLTGHCDSVSTAGRVPTDAIRKRLELNWRPRETIAAVDSGFLRAMGTEMVGNYMFCGDNINALREAVQQSADSLGTLAATIRGCHVGQVDKIGYTW